MSNKRAELAAEIAEARAAYQRGRVRRGTVDYDNCILFEFAQNPESGEEEILLLTMGTRDEVY